MGNPYYDRLKEQGLLETQQSSSIPVANGNNPYYKRMTQTIPTATQQTENTTQLGNIAKQELSDARTNRNKAIGELLNPFDDVSTKEASTKLKTLNQKVDTAKEQAKSYLPTVGERAGARISSAWNGLVGGIQNYAEGVEYRSGQKSRLLNDNADYIRLDLQKRDLQKKLEDAYTQSERQKYSNELKQVQESMKNVQNEYGKNDVFVGTKGNDKLETAAEKSAIANAGYGNVGQWLGNTQTSILQNIPTMALGTIGMVTGQAWLSGASLALMGASAAGNELKALSDRNIGVNKALGVATAKGAIEIVTEKMGMDNLANLITNGGKTVLSSLASQMLSEGGEEAASYLMGFMVDKISEDPEASFSITDLLSQAASGALSGLVFGTTSIPSTISVQNATRTLYDQTSVNGGKAFLDGKNADVAATEKFNEMKKNDPNFNALVESGRINESEFTKRFKDGYEAERIQHNYDTIAELEMNQKTVESEVAELQSKVNSNQDDISSKRQLAEKQIELENIKKQLQERNETKLDDIVKTQAQYANQLGLTAEEVALQAYSDGFVTENEFARDDFIEKVQNAMAEQEKGVTNDGTNPIAKWSADKRTKQSAFATKTAYESQNARRENLSHLVNVEGGTTTTQAILTTNADGTVVYRDINVLNPNIVSQDPMMSRIANQFKKLGANATFYVGEVLADNGKAVNGWNNGKDIFLQADDIHPIERVSMHELFHYMVHNTKAGQKIFNSMLKVWNTKYTEEQKKSIVSKYVEAYSEYDVNSTDIVEEILADTYSHLNEWNFTEQEQTEYQQNYGTLSNALNKKLPMAKDLLRNDYSKRFNDKTISDDSGQGEAEMKAVEAEIDDVKANDPEVIESVSTPTYDGTTGVGRFSRDTAPENVKALLDSGRRVNVGTLMSGGGTVDFALASFIHNNFAFELMPRISAVFQSNNKTDFMGSDILSYEPGQVEKVDHLHISPVCKTFSRMINKVHREARKDSSIDMILAKKSAEIIEDQMARTVSIENVAEYLGEPECDVIINKLLELGYNVDPYVYNSADYGSATSRDRLFIRASLDELPPRPEPTHKNNHRSWGEVAGDMLSELQEADANPRMIESLLTKSGIDVNNIDRPLLVFGESYKNGEFGHAFIDETVPTIIAKSGASRVFMPDGRVLEATPELLARISGLPKEYKLPKQKVLARTIVGNGIPVELTQAVVEPMLYKQLEMGENTVQQKSRFSFKVDGEEVKGGLNIDDSTFPFSQKILDGSKKAETRDAIDPHLNNVAKSGERIALVRSGVGNYKAYATAKIGNPIEVTAEMFDNPIGFEYASQFGVNPDTTWRDIAQIPNGNDYDVKAEIGKKYFYPLIDVKPLSEEITPKSHSPRYAKFSYKQSKHVDTATETDLYQGKFAAEADQAILDGKFDYKTTSNKRNVQYGESFIRSNGLEAAIDRTEQATKAGRWTLEDMAVAEVALQEAVRTNNPRATQLLIDISLEGSRLGQVVQAMSLIKKLSGKNQAVYLLRAIRQINKDMAQQKGGVQIDINSKEIQDAIAKIQKAKNQTEINKAMEEAFEIIGKKLPMTFSERLNAWRYLSMLGNTRTQVRNILGNFMWAGITTAKNAVNYGVEQVYKLINKNYQGNRSLTVNKADVDFAKADYDNVNDMIMGGGKYSVKEGILSKRLPFKSQALNKYSAATDWIMDFGDKIFSKGRYSNSFAQWMKAHDVSVDQLKKDAALLQQAREFAINDAQKATFRDMTQIAKFLNKMKSDLRYKANHGETANERAFGKAMGVLIEGLVPFTKTPAAILARGVEYSPVGLFKGVYDILSKTTDASVALDELSAGLTGSALIGIGMMLASMGVLKGTNDDDDEYDEMLGKSEYSLKIPNNNWVSVDWAAPTTMGLLVGANIYEDWTEGKINNLKSLLDDISAMAEPMVDMSMLQGVQSAIQAAGNGKSPISSIVTTMATGYVGQLVPTFLGHIANATDSSQRKTYYDPNLGGMSKAVSAAAQKQIAKIPGARNALLTESTDVWGNTKENTGSNFFGRLVYNALSPSYLNKYNETAVDTEIKRLIAATGETSLSPDYGGKYFTNDGERYNLNAKEYETYSKIKGQTAYNVINEMIQSADYQAMGNTEQANAIEWAYKYGDYLARKEIMGDKFVPTDSMKTYIKAEEASEYGLTPAQYNTIRSGASAYEKSEEKRDYLMSTSISGEQKNGIADSLGIGDRYDFSDMETYTLSSMSESAYDKYYLINNGKMSFDNYVKAYNAYAENDDKTKIAVLGRIVNSGISTQEANWFYKNILQGASTNISATKAKKLIKAGMTQEQVDLAEKAFKSGKTLEDRIQSLMENGFTRKQAEWIARQILN